ncbi:hypothetical protein QX201_008141 [Fusarium graminearum]
MCSHSGPRRERPPILVIAMPQDRQLDIVMPVSHVSVRGVYHTSTTTESKNLAMHINPKLHLQRPHHTGFLPAIFTLNAKSKHKATQATPEALV